jgi:transcriptional activator SPT8
VVPQVSTQGGLQNDTSATTTASNNAASIQLSSDGVSSTEPQAPPDSDANSDASFDPLFDDEPDASDSMRVGKNDVVTLPLSNQASRSVQSQPLQRTQVGHVAPPKNAPPLLDPTEYATYSPDILMTAAIDGQIILWDKRANTVGKGVGRLWMSEKTPPWCLSVNVFLLQLETGTDHVRKACWSADGAQLYAGRRNGTVDVWDVRQLGRSGTGNTPRLLKTLRNPLSSGVVSCVVAFPDCRHIAW